MVALLWPLCFSKFIFWSFVPMSTLTQPLVSLLNLEQMKHSPPLEIFIISYSSFLSKKQFPQCMFAEHNDYTPPGEVAIHKTHLNYPYVSSPPHLL